MSLLYTCEEHGDNCVVTYIGTRSTNCPICTQIEALEDEVGELNDKLEESEELRRG